MHDWLTGRFALHYEVDHYYVFWDGDGKSAGKIFSKYSLELMYNVVAQSVLVIVPKVLHLIVVLLPVHGDLKASKFLSMIQNEFMPF